MRLFSRKPADSAAEVDSTSVDDGLERHNSGNRSSRNYPDFDKIHVCTQNAAPWSTEPGTHCRTCGRALHT